MKISNGLFGRMPVSNRDIKMKKINIKKTPIYSESWNVAYRKKAGDGVLENLDQQFTVIQNSFQYWAADPFLFENGDDIYVFAELYDYRLCRGVIGYYQINAVNPKWKPVIQEDYHLSYPHIFRKNGEIYILPEANASNSLYLYKAVHFPDQWEKQEPVIKNLKLVDTTLFQVDGTWFALSYKLGNPNTLVLINTDSFQVKEIYKDYDGIRRPAGLMDGMHGIRVAQNCIEDYGKGIIVYKFQLDQNTDYSEHEIRTVYPNELSLSGKLFLDGMHTYNQSERYEVVDIKTRRFNPLNFIVRLVRAGKRKISNKH